MVGAQVKAYGFSICSSILYDDEACVLRDDLQWRYVMKFCLSKTLGGSHHNGFLSSPEMNTRRPTRLEALPIEATAKAFKKLKELNSIDVV